MLTKLVTTLMLVAIPIALRFAVSLDAEVLARAAGKPGLGPGLKKLSVLEWIAAPVWVTAGLVLANFLSEDRHWLAALWAAAIASHILAIALYLAFAKPRS